MRFKINNLHLNRILLGKTVLHLDFKAFEHLKNTHSYRQDLISTII